MTKNATILGITLISLGSLTVSAQDETEEPDALEQQQVVPQDPVAAYESLLREIRDVTLFNTLLQRHIEGQEADLEAIATAIEGIPELETRIPPLLVRMVDGLSEFVDLDTPFKMSERNDRVEILYGLLEDSSASDTDKLRRILGAWLIEVLEYGNDYDTEQGEVEIDGSVRSVDFFILGRVGLFFQTSDDEALTGAWDPRTNSWAILGSEHRNPVRQAIRMARSQIAPDLLLMPTLPPQSQ